MDMRISNGKALLLRMLLSVWKLCDFAAIAQEATHRKVDESSPGHSLLAFRSHGTFYDLFCRGSDLDGDGGARFDAFTTKFGQSSMYRNDHHSILRDGYTPPSFGALLCSGRRFFVTMTEFVGVAVPSTQVGDLVTVLFGILLALRRFLSQRTSDICRGRLGKRSDGRRAYTILRTRVF